MRQGVTPIIESLELRQFLSTTTRLGGLCLGPSLPPPPTGELQAPPPQPAPSPAPGHHHHHRGGGVPAAPPLDVVLPMLLGDWIGSSTAGGRSTDILEVRVSQSHRGDLFAKVNFKGRTLFQGSAQVKYNSRNGHFALFVMSPKLVVKFDGSLATNTETIGVAGTLQTYTRKGAYKAVFNLHKSIPNYQ